jgi:hypothetical protein
MAANGHVGSGIGNGIGIDPVAVAMRSALIETELGHSHPGGRAMHDIVRSLCLAVRSALRTMCVSGNPELSH